MKLMIKSLHHASAKAELESDLTMTKLKTTEREIPIIIYELLLEYVEESFYLKRRISLNKNSIIIRIETREPERNKYGYLKTLFESKSPTADGSQTLKFSVQTIKKLIPLK
ncbi:hypothetical protein HHI36_023969 [Cryptolaemus montrouzieri]|uniref:Uncharacterized protein n=1 Tax=Cryptolaemus montrouzieri TaxID=559131 RepID=A0ABD2MVB4_9CUCU